MATITTETRYIGKKTGNNFTPAAMTDLVNSQTPAEVAAKVVAAGAGAIVCNVAKGAKFYTLVHNGTRVIAYVDGPGEVWTLNTIYCADTKTECLAESERLHLEPLKGMP